MKYITTKEAGEQWGISDRRVQLLCKQGRIEDAYRLGWTWAIPEDAVKPLDNRTRIGRASKSEMPNGNSEITENVVQ